MQKDRIFQFLSFMVGASCVLSAVTRDKVSLATNQQMQHLRILYDHLQVHSFTFCAMAQIQYRSNLRTHLPIRERQDNTSEDLLLWIQIVIKGRISKGQTFNSILHLSNTIDECLKLSSPHHIVELEGVCAGYMSTRTGSYVVQVSQQLTGERGDTTSMHRGEDLTCMSIGCLTRQNL